MRPGDPDRGRGLYQKFVAYRADGSSGPGGKHEGCALFVLDVDHDEHARPALAAYANAVAGEYPQLAEDIFAKLRSMPAPPVDDPVPRPTSDGRPDAVPPLIAAEAIGAFAEYLLALPAFRRPGAEAGMFRHVRAFCETQGLAVPRRGWQQLVKPMEGCGNG